VIIKEVGWGISTTTARKLLECGVSAIDVAGAGGTSWSQVEAFRSKNENILHLAASFRDWGIPTAESIRNVVSLKSDLIIIASGGVNNGIAMAKCVALGASLTGAANIFLQAAAISADKVKELIDLFQMQIKLSMFVTGSKKLKDLSGKLTYIE
jgi:isopentenyl-diphosphate delta-isomerase